MAVTPWTVRDIREGDAPGILLLARSLGEWFNAEGLSKVGRDLMSHEGFVAVRGDRILGFLTWTPIDKEIVSLSWVGVAESEQRKGIGRSLVRALLAEVRTRGFQQVEVSTVADSVDYEPYDRTRRFYRAMGFVDHRVDEDYFGTEADRYDRLVLRLDLRATPM